MIIQRSKHIHREKQTCTSTYTEDWLADLCIANGGSGQRASLFSFSFFFTLTLSPHSHPPPSRSSPPFHRLLTFATSQYRCTSLVVSSTHSPTYFHEGDEACRGILSLATSRSVACLRCTIYSQANLAKSMADKKKKIESDIN